jgi:hypothetical protein
VFDETNGSQVEQVDLDELDNEEALCIALRNMSIGDVYPKESKEPTQVQDQLSSSNQASPPTQDEEQAQDDKDENQEDEPHQEEDNDQGGDEDNENKEIQGQRPPHPTVYQTIQRDHPVNSILGVGTMLRRRRSYRKRQLQLKLLIRDAEGTVHEASVFQHIRR